MCNLYSVTTNQAAIINLFRVINCHVGNLAPMPGIFPDYPASVIRNKTYRADLGQLAAVMLIGFLSLRRTVP
jgi:putative SOS response-associated peptidase YedK